MTTAVNTPLAVNKPLLSTLLSTQSAAVSTLSLLTHHLYLAAIAVIGFQLRWFKLCNCNCCYKGEHFTLCRCLDWVLGQPAIDCNNCPRDKINNPPRGSPVITTSHQPPAAAPPTEKKHFRTGSSQAAAAEHLGAIFSIWAESPCLPQTMWRIINKPQDCSGTRRLWAAWCCSGETEH